VQDLSLTVADGELVVLVGPSGCGKTTTLRLIAGLETPTAGKVLIGGRDVTPLPPRERDVAMIFQRPATYPHLDVRRNLSMGLEMRQYRRWFSKADLAEVRRSNQTIEQRVEAVSRLLQLDGLLQRRSDELSGGQQQRVALGRALVRQPAVYLLDEPLSQLDLPLRTAMRRELHLLQRRLPATMLYVTHDPAEALMLGDRVVVLAQGAVQQVGPPLTVYRQPANRLVASFLGWPPMNFLDGRLAVVEGELCLTAANRQLRLPQTRLAEWSPFAGREVALGIRAEDVRVLPRAGRTADEVLPPMEVELVEPLGFTTLVTLRWGGWQLTGRHDGTELPKRGQMAAVELNMHNAHLFDPCSGGNRIGGRPAG
jgi:multiple sugar transport system ATP-binding protein